MQHSFQRLPIRRSVMVDKEVKKDGTHLKDARIDQIARMSNAEIIAEDRAKGGGPKRDARHERETIAQVVVDAAARRRSRSER
jgi:hypothetical protein